MTTNSRAFLNSDQMIDDMITHELPEYLQQVAMLRKLHQEGDEQLAEMKLRLRQKQTEMQLFEKEMSNLQTEYMILRSQQVCIGRSISDKLHFIFLRRDRLVKHAYIYSKVSKCSFRNNRNHPI